MKKLFIIVIVALFISGCVLTKVLTVPMRVTAAVISVVPPIAYGAENVIVKSADLIDAIPI
jgi:PBP1b-binding outer membrane lipoprotein LpoB